MMEYNARPAGWKTSGRHQWPRVAFVAHALLPGYRSTALIDARLNELQLPWATSGSDPPPMGWFSFPVVAQNGHAHHAWVDFYIVPILAPQFLQAVGTGDAYRWVERVALASAMEAGADNTSLTVGWGALTKNATDHGRLFLERHAAFPVATTHGDAGTAAFVLETLRLAGVRPGFRVTVIGANGAIGDLVSRTLPQLRPQNIMLVGKQDKAGLTTNRDRLERLRAEVLASPGGDSTQVYTHLDKSRACLDHDTDVVIVATNGMSLRPLELPPGALVLDLCTPAACTPSGDWSQLVLTSGCGQIPEGMLPEGFGTIVGNQITDCGAGGERVLWGCTIETIVHSLTRRRGHVAGQSIPISELAWCSEHFTRFGITPQPPTMFGRSLEWGEVREFVSRFRPHGGA